MQKLLELDDVDAVYIDQKWKEYTLQEAPLQDLWIHSSRESYYVNLWTGSAELCIYSEEGIMVFGRHLHFTSSSFQFEAIKSKLL